MARLNPFIKWVGGKRKIADIIKDNIKPLKEGNRYFEPFIGSGALLFSVQPQKAVCSDTNEELINLYNIVKYSLPELIEVLEEHKRNHCKDYYYTIRNLDRQPGFLADVSHEHMVIRAARFLYLNKTCYNGLWRVNSKGENNVPMGRYAEPNIVPEVDLRKASEYFSTNDIQFVVRDYQCVLDDAQEGDVVYFDPPYDVEEGQSQFVEYTKSRFNPQNQQELKDLCDKLIDKGVFVAISNSNTARIKTIYNGSDEDRNRYTIKEIPVKRLIGAQIESRHQVTELLIIGGNNNGNEKTITTSE